MANGINRVDKTKLLCFTPQPMYRHSFFLNLLRLFELVCLARFLLVVIISLSVVGDLFIVFVFLAATVDPARGSGKLYSRVRPWSVSPWIVFNESIIWKEESVTSVSPCRNQYQIQICVHACVMSCDLFYDTLFGWIKLLWRHLHQIRGNRADGIS